MQRFVPQRDRVNELLVKMVNLAETICMSIAVAILLAAQAAGPAAAEAPVSRTALVAEQVRASVTIRRPARVTIADNGTVELDASSDPRTVQRSRDAAGTLWLEFS